MENITLDMIPNGYTPTAHISQYDNGRHIRFNLLNITLAGSETVRLKIRKPNGTTVSKIIENHTSYVEYVSEGSDCDIDGMADCEITISNGTDVIGSKNFKMKIEADAYDSSSVTTDTASGTVASFETDIVDNVIELTADINPVQDLHGYDHPWIGGAGKNIYPTINSLETATTAGITFTRNQDGSISVKGTATSVADFPIFGNMQTENNAFSIEAGTYTISTTGCSANVGYIFGGGDGTSGLAYDDFRTNPKSKTVTLESGTTGHNIIRVSAGATVDTKIYIQWEAGSTATAYEPYENICPIDGFTEANIVNTDNNNVAELFELDDEFRGRVNFNQLVKNGNFADSSHWSKTANTFDYVFANNTVTLSATTTLTRWNGIQNSSIDSASVGHKLLIHATTKAEHGIVEIGANATTPTPQYNISAGEWYESYALLRLDESSQPHFFQIRFGTSYSDYQIGESIMAKNAYAVDLTQLFGTTIADYIYTLEQANAGAGVEFFKSFYPDDYYAYNAGTDELVGKAIPVTVNFNQTVYGGVLTCKNGQWKVSSTWGIINLSTLNWGYIPVASSYPYGVFYSTINDKKFGAFNILCDSYATATESNFLNDKKCLGNASGTAIYITDGDYTDSTAFKNSLANVNMLYELATPIEIDLTADQVETLLGNNNIYHDCNGPVEVRFWKKA